MADPDDDPTLGDTDRMVRAAFGGTAPSLPALSSDGRTAALGWQEYVGETDVYGYWVWFVPLGGGAIDVTAVIDRDLAAALVDQRDLDPGGPDPFDPGRIAAAAAAVDRRLRAGGYRPLTPLPLAGEGVAIGDAVFGHGVAAGGGCRVELRDRDGRPRAAESFPVLDLGRCRYRPGVYAVWTDPAATRVLFLIGHASAHGCEDLDPIARLWEVA